MRVNCKDAKAQPDGTIMCEKTKEPCAFQRYCEMEGRYMVADSAQLCKRRMKK